jgi:hypothetical protein
MSNNRERKSVTVGEKQLRGRSSACRKTKKCDVRRVLIAVGQSARWERDRMRGSSGEAVAGKCGRLICLHEQGNADSRFR